MKKYVAYTYDATGFGWIGWLMWGWYIVKIIPTRELAMSILEDIHNEGLDEFIMVLETDPPLPQKFWFKPERAVRLIYAETPESKSSGESIDGRTAS